MPDPGKRKKQAIISNYKNKGINTKLYPNFNIDKDTIIQGKSINLSTAMKIESLSRRNAGISSRPIKELTTLDNNTGSYTVQKLYKKKPVFKLKSK